MSGVAQSLGLGHKENPGAPQKAGERIPDFGGIVSATSAMVHGPHGAVRGSMVSVAKVAPDKPE
jgi:hypothetical protein